MNEPARYLGLDLGGTNIKAAVLEEHEGGRPPGIVARETHPTQSHRGPEHVMARLAGLAGDLVRKHSAVRAVGVGLPGVFDETTGTTMLLPNLPGPWSGVPVRDPVSEGCGRPVALVNDARAFSLAESVLGAARGLSTVVCVTLGTGVGGGLVVDGRLHLGSGTAGEIGHQTVHADGPPCGCGNTGCVEALTCAAAFCRLGGRESPEEVYAAARAGDRRAREAVDHVVRWLGIALANAYMLVAPDAFVVGGGVAAAGADLLEPLQDEVRRRVRLVRGDDIRVLPSEVGPYAGAAGAALRAREFGWETVNTASMT